MNLHKKKMVEKSTAHLSTKLPRKHNETDACQTTTILKVSGLLYYTNKFRTLGEFRNNDSDWNKIRVSVCLKSVRFGFGLIKLLSIWISFIFFDYIGNVLRIYTLIFIILIKLHKREDK